MKASDFFIISALSIVFFSCSTKEEKLVTIEPKIGKYIYIDDNMICHIDPNCFRLKRGIDDNGHDIYAKQLVDTAKFIIPESECFRVCTRCVGDNEYEHLIRLSSRNSYEY